MTRSPFLPRVGMRYEAWEPAGTVDVPGKGTFPQKFMPGAFDRQIGKVVPLRFGERPEPGTADARPALGHVRVIAAEVAPGGNGVMFTYEVIDLDQEGQ